MRLGIIGLGNMGSAILSGILQNGLLSAEDVIGAEVSSKRRFEIGEKYGIAVTESSREAAEKSDILLLSIKPQVYEAVIADIKEVIRPEQIIISIAPGKTIGWLTEQFGKELKLVRCMPNTPALVLEGCTGVCKSPSVSDEEFETVLKLLQSFGKAYRVEEKQMDAVVAISGSSPAYVFMLIEAMADAGVAEGLPRASAYEFAAQAVLGSAKMVLTSGKHPAELKDMVCSPAGTTIEAVEVLEEKGFRAAVMEAMRVCAKRSREL
ncbi:MAG: pyrroline-5-carboxylate reductase [Lachnospiraceae bacterium]|nr:pyrroline-5-carboxylate reductase [Lachnospiraceae bacterium]